MSNAWKGTITIDEWNKMHCVATRNANASGFTCDQVEVPSNKTIDRALAIQSIDFSGAPDVRVTAKALSVINVDYEYAGKEITCSKAGRYGLLCKARY